MPVALGQPASGPVLRMMRVRNRPNGIGGWPNVCDNAPSLIPVLAREVLFFFKTRLERLRKAVWELNRLCYDSLAINRGGCNYLIFLLEIVLMKKNVLALSIAAMVGGLGFAGAASAALSVNESGTGHILMVPYYTAQNGNMTVFHLTNTDTVHGKAVKVRFRGASNSDDVLDFQVFMSPGDVWTAAVTADASGLAQLVTADNTCTLPRISAGTPVKFVTDRLAKSDWTATDKAAQTREGYVEILNMADIPENANGDKGLFKAIKHVNGVAPCTSAILNQTLSVSGVGPAATNLSLGSNTNPDLTIPTGGLTGSWYVMNVAQTTTFSGATPAIVASGATRNVFSHQKTGGALLETADPLMVGGAIPAQHYDVPDLSTPYEAATTTAAAQAEELTSAIARTSVINQYATDTSISAKTDWVFSMPTRRYTIAANYAAGAVNQVVGNVTGTSLAGGTVTLPGTTPAYRFINNNVAVANNIFRTASNTTVNNAGQICVEAQSQTFYDREERFQEDGAIFSPGTISRTQLCGEVSVLAFSADNSALAASVARQNVAAPYTNGWGVVNFNAPTPLLGAAFLKLTNPEAAPGTSGTYGITWPHAYR